MKALAQTITRKMQALFLSALACGAAFGQITPSADSYTNTADAATNYGGETLLDVDGASQIAYIQFDLASIPATAGISQATLNLYVSSVTTAGSFNVDYVNGAWVENTIDASNAPPLGVAPRALLLHPPHRVRRGRSSRLPLRAVLPARFHAKDSRAVR